MFGEQTVRVCGACVCRCFQLLQERREKRPLSSSFPSTLTTPSVERLCKCQTGAVVTEKKCALLNYFLLSCLFFSTLSFTLCVWPSFCPKGTVVCLRADTRARPWAKCHCHSWVWRILWLRLPSGVMKECAAQRQTERPGQKEQENKGVDLDGREGTEMLWLAL